MTVLKKVLFYQTTRGQIPCQDWMESLDDRRALATLKARIRRMALGNLGDYRSVGHGVVELRIHYGPGYRLYAGLHGFQIVVLLCGGDKSSQSADIDRAHEFWDDFRRRL